MALLGRCVVSKNFQFLSIIFLGICLLLSSWFISQSLETKHVEYVDTPSKQTSTQDVQNRYEFITIVSDYFIIFDKQTGDYWQKVGSSDWEKQNSILKSSKQ
ncbi:hypothetical protein BSK49_08730 [Paenibacillus odorifer]|uniref:Uncharacterized protein n=1 Tax=Paenibacillus odorifer TaxID=189426 RepID=A0ABX3GDM4_9BACL|nr:hypothetical protein BSO21_31305 [Paenibacillus odorifer]OMD90746.1 hypothetical protein BSK49_08730 [Paenibacillus odorifer]